MISQLQKAFDIAKKTGDKIIVVDSHDPGNTFVVMSIDEYEKLISGKNTGKNLTDDEMIDKINRDIALLHDEDEELGDSFDEETEIPKEAWVLEDENQENANPKSHWSIPKERKEGAEEILEEEENEDEERQYLEEVVF